MERQKETGNRKGRYTIKNRVLIGSFVLIYEFYLTEFVMKDIFPKSGVQVTSCTLPIEEGRRHYSNIFNTPAGNILVEGRGSHNMLFKSVASVVHMCEITAF